MTIIVVRSKFIYTYNLYNKIMIIKYFSGDDTKHILVPYKIYCFELLDKGFFFSTFRYNPV